MIQINDYIKEKRLELSATILNRTIIYLDTKFWNNLRKAENSIDQQILAKVIELSETMKAIFPISEMTFWEILKQGDKDSRDKTIALVDKLSEGISIINSDERKHLELRLFIKKQNGNETHDLKELVWSKIPFVLGYDFLSNIESIEGQKSLFDFISNISMLETVTLAERNTGLNSFKFKDNIDALNQNKEKYKGENNSAEDMFLSELAGYIELSDKSLEASIFNKFKNKEIKNELPVFQIVPLLFAKVRLNTNQKFRDGNDTIDFLHASFALPYCNFFFTENKLHSMITQLKLDNLYDCRVESKPEKVLEILELIK